VGLEDFSFSWLHSCLCAINASASLELQAADLVKDGGRLLKKNQTKLKHLYFFATTVDQRLVRAISIAEDVDLSCDGRSLYAAKTALKGHEG
jgi:hypothetical protein